MENMISDNEEAQDSISKEDLELIKDAQEKFRFSSISHKNFELELNNNILKIYLKYGLSERDSIDTASGKISKTSST